jgi:hypothetical protein
MTVISFKHSFVFVKTTKTAGTSIEVELSKIAGDDAIVTPIVPEVAGHAPRNYASADGSALFSGHMTAVAIRNLIGPKTFQQMHKFCVEREPVSKCISDFHMRRNSPVRNKDGKYRKDWPTYCAKGRFPIDLDKYSEKRGGVRQVIVDELLAYEQLAQALPVLLQKLGVQDFTLRARAKSEYGRNPLIEDKAVTNAERRRIYRAFLPTLNLTGMYPIDDELVGSRHPLLGHFSKWRPWARW